MGHDLFLSYSRADTEAVRDARAQLEARGVRTFVDWHDLDPGRPWPEALERALRDTRVVAVFAGRSGLGVWQKREVYYALDLQGHSSLRVVPILLRGADPPAGFLALNTWVDLRGGIDAASIAPLVRLVEGLPPEAPSIDVCPYRDLRSFREEDAALFFGRGEAIDTIVGKIDRMRFVAIVGPSGSGKSSVAVAGVLPRLRGRRPPDAVWDGVVFTPGTQPWRSFADAIVPLLEPELSTVEKIHKGGLLGEALQQPGGIASTIARVLAESRGTDRLLVVIDQFEELFTLNDADAARAFLHALFEESRGVPMTVLVTLRSDYYGKAIALDRHLSNALPDAQVNLGPMRADELRECVVRPAAIVGLSFEPGLVDRILDDVGREPGNLPLLEYALSELWERRAGRELTFAAYQEIGGVPGALARRANALYDPLGPAEKNAVRRLMTRLVQVSAADEEGADTRRRARREELDDEAWKVVDPFVKARLLVVGEHDTVEVAHEALIRKWERLREWLNEDRRFLLWRQQLAVYREAWPDVLPPGALLTQSQKWWRERRAELSASERAYIERSATSVMRSRKFVRLAVVAALLVALLVVGSALHRRSTGYNIQRILDSRLEEQFHADYSYGPQYEGNLADLALLIRLGREPQILQTVRASNAESILWSQVAVAMHRAGRTSVADELLQHAEKEHLAGRWVRFEEVVRARVRIGQTDAARALLLALDGKLANDLRTREQLARSWQVVGDRERARRALLNGLDEPVDPSVLDTLIRLNDPADAQRIATAVDAMLATLKMPTAMREVEFQFVVQAFIDAGNLERAGQLAALSPTRFTGDEIRKNIAIAEARRRNVVPDSRIFDSIDNELTQNNLVDEVLAHFARTKRDADAEKLIAIVPRDLTVAAQAHYVKHLADAGRFEKAIEEAERATTFRGGMLDKLWLDQIEARHAYALARAGKREDAAARIERLSASPAANEVRRDEIRAILASALAALDRYHDARVLADSIEDDNRQRDAYFAILRAHAGI